MNTAMSFEAHLQRLEAIVERLDGEPLALDAALGLFEEGIELLRQASTELGVVEAKVKSLVEQANGVLETRDFDA